MGSSISKVTNIMETITDDNSTPPAVAPLLTPQIKILNSDPRSPSCGIARTPIEILRTPLGHSRETSSLDISEDLSLQQIDLDPRSPTTEFHRTPITTEDQLLKKLVLRNKNFDNVLTPDVTITPIKPKRNLNKVTKKICNLSKPPKLLESSPITETITSKRNSFVGLLETNLDYIETDLDVVIQNKRKGEHDDGGKEESLREITEVPEFVIEKMPEDLQPEIENDSREDNEGQIEPHEKIQEVSCNDHEVPPVDVQVVPSNDLETSTQTQLQEELPVMDTATRASLVVDELDRKLTNLIYEDIQTEASPKTNIKLQQCRTPLGDRNLNQQKKSIPVLKVSDKPSKSMAISKIPVFKEKRGKMDIQCENTPPRTMAKRSQWGAEDSLVI